jgi:NAD(P)-dependent dehydrogenase (short-subunit alcohol dehydrogenase family)
VALLGTTEQLSVASIRRVMEVNFYGSLHVIQAALPALRSARGRLIAVTSCSGAVGQPFNDGYCASKFAIEGLLESLAPVVAQHGVTVTMIEPGPVKTELVSNFVTVRTIDVPSTPYPDPVEFLKGLLTTMPDRQTADDVAAIIVHAMTTPSPVLRMQTSDWSRNYIGIKLADLDGEALLNANKSWLG